MIDHLMAFATEPDAFNDPIVGQYHELGTKGNPPAWHAEANPDILVFDPAMDTIEPVPGPPPHDTVVHHPIDTQFRVVITLPHPDPDLIDHPNLELAVDHVQVRVLGGSFTDVQLGSLAMQPVFSGSAYPFLTNITRGLGRR
jgi:hypothetical protein